MRKFAAEQYAQNGIHLHPLTTPQQLEKLPDGRLKFTAGKRSGGQVGGASLPGMASTPTLVGTTCTPRICLPMLLETSTPEQPSTFSP